MATSAQSRSASSAPADAADGETARLLRHGALYVHDDLPVARATDRDLLSDVVSRWADFEPLHRWLVAHVQRT